MNTDVVVFQAVTIFIQLLFILKYLTFLKKLYTELW